MGINYITLEEEKYDDYIKKVGEELSRREELTTNGFIISQKKRISKNIWGMKDKNERATKKSWFNNIKEILEKIQKIFSKKKIDSSVKLQIIKEWEELTENGTIK